MASGLRGTTLARFSRLKSPPGPSDRLIVPTTGQSGLRARSSLSRAVISASEP